MMHPVFDMIFLTLTDRIAGHRSHDNILKEHGEELVLGSCPLIFTFAENKPIILICLGQILRKAELLITVMRLKSQRALFQKGKTLTKMAVFQVLNRLVCMYMNKY